MKQWMTRAQIQQAGLAGWPRSRPGIVIRAGKLGLETRRRGNRIEYHVETDDGGAEDTAPVVDWAGWEAQTEKAREVSIRRAEAVDRVLELSAKTGRMAAMAQVAKEMGVSAATLRRWCGLVRGIARADWLPVLIPSLIPGRPLNMTTCSEAMEYFKSVFLQPEKPSFAVCYEWTEAAGEERGWVIAPLPSFRRQFEREVSSDVITYCREGRDAVKNLVPPQRRSIAHMRSMEAINIDGHRWDVMVEWPDGRRARPMMVAAQDVATRKILAWRIAMNEDALTVRLMFADLFRDYGLPDVIYMDNSRAFAAKNLTGGMQNRFRFKPKPEDPKGLLEMLKIEAKFVMPYSGQSKPIERGFRDMAAQARHPAFAGAYTGNTTSNKPDNYGSRAVPLAEFIEAAGEIIHRHNDKRKRRTEACGGIMSFSEAFEKRLDQAKVRKPSAAQLRLALLGSQPVMPDRRNGMVSLAGNRYHSPWMTELRGRKVVVRFDPEMLHQEAFIYDLKGKYLGAAALLLDSGFDNMGAAKDHARKRKQYIKKTKELAALEKALHPHETAAMIPRRAGKLRKIGQSGNVHRIAPDVNSGIDLPGDEAYGNIMRLNTNHRR